LSTSFPLSIIIGFNPAFARASQQKIPAGQNPIISGLCSGFLEHFLITYENSSTNLALCFLNFSKSKFVFFNSKSTEQINKISLLSLESIDFFTIFKFIKFSFLIQRSFIIFHSKLFSSSFIESFISSSLSNFCIFVLF
jgi:hypothetical protein